MNDTIRDITTEHLGPDATDSEAILTRVYLLAHGYEGSDLLGDVGVTDWRTAVEWALHFDAGTPLPDDPTAEQVAFNARNSAKA